MRTAFYKLLLAAQFLAATAALEVQMLVCVCVSVCVSVSPQVFETCYNSNALRDEEISSLLNLISDFVVACIDHSTSIWSFSYYL